MKSDEDAGVPRLLFFMQCDVITQIFLAMVNPDAEPPPSLPWQVKNLSPQKNPGLLPGPLALNQSTIPLTHLMPQLFHLMLHK